MRPSLRPPRILVVDDDFDIREALAGWLSGHAEIMTARHGGEALVLLRGCGPDLPSLILLDMMMPGLDGLGVLCACAADPALAAIPVVTMTADPSLEPAARAHAQVRVHLTKPFDLDELDRVVLALLLPSAAP